MQSLKKICNIQIAFENVRRVNLSSAELYILAQKGLGERLFCIQTPWEAETNNLFSQFFVQDCVSQNSHPSYAPSKNGGR